MDELLTGLFKNILYEAKIKGVRMSADGQRVVNFDSQENLDKKIKKSGEAGVTYRAYNPQTDSHLSTGTDTTPQPSAKQPGQPKDKKRPPAPRAPRIKRTKIEKIDSDRTEVISSFGDTTLDVEGLMRAVEGVESQEKGEKGAGTKASTAGEAATTLSVEKLRLLRAQQPDKDTHEFLKESMPEIVKLLSELRGVKKSALSEDWAEAARKQAMAIFYTVEGKYNSRINEIAWDNASGRKALGLGAKPKSDRSDLYIKTDKGKVIGISLKKDGNIFLANQGLQKVLRSIAEKAPDKASAEKINGITKKHKETVSKKAKELLATSKARKKVIVPHLSNLTRDKIKDVESEKYNKFFDKNGKLTKETIDMLTSGGTGLTVNKKGEPKKYTSEEYKLFLKAMAAVSNDVADVKTNLEGMRAADRVATQALLELVRSDTGVNETMTTYLIDALDLVQLVTPKKPFGEDYGVDKFFIVYGEANLQEDGQEHPMSVTRDTILSTLDLPDTTSDEELEKAVRSSFVVDADEDSKIGFLRLRIKNQSPPPNYFYPSISTLGIRSKGLGSAPTMELEQHSGWTYTLLNKSPNPKNWPRHHQYAQAVDSVEYLTRQLDNSALTEEQKAEIQNDIDFYENIIRG